MGYPHTVAREKVDPARKKSAMVQIRCRPGEREAWEQAYDHDEYPSLSEWLRDLANARVREIEGSTKKTRKRGGTSG